MLTHSFHLHPCCCLFNLTLRTTSRPARDGVPGRGDAIVTAEEGDEVGHGVPPAQGGFRWVPEVAPASLLPCRIIGVAHGADRGHYVVMQEIPRDPSFDDVLRDVLLVRSRGAGRLRGLGVPALRDATVLADVADAQTTEPAPVLHLLRQAVDTLGGGSLQEAAEYSLGLYPGTALWSSAERRERAAEQFGVTADTFRKKPERELLGQVAEAVLALLHDTRLRRARADIEAHRHPADSRLAVQWVERFEAYYRIWTPVYALGANLEAALEVYTHEPLPHLPWDEHSEQAYDPIEYARSYAQEALYNYTQFHLELKRFKSKHGGLWLASDVDTEQHIADAVYRIGWHNNFFEDDEAWLRRQLADSRHEETDHFWHIVLSFDRGQRIHAQWQTLIAKAVSATTEAQQATSQPHLTIAACNDYTQLIDAEWIRIADWYRPGVGPRRGVEGKELYQKLNRVVE